MIALILLLLVLSLTCPVQAQQRYEYPYEKRVFSGPVSERYRGQEVISSKDVILFGSTVVVDEWLRTNGGDVVIFAESLVIEAPIDTRVYFNHAGDFVEETTGECKSLRDWLTKEAPTAVSSYRRFYLMSDDVWDGETKSFRLTEGKEFSEVPSGLTKCAPPGRPSSEGGSIDETKIDWKALKSGSITVVAHTISFCQSCGKLPVGWDGLKREIPERGPDLPFEERAFFITRGIRGSRGYMPAWGCRYGKKLDPNCRELSTKARRGIGTRGGDAGSIRISIVNNNAWYEQHRDTEILPRISSHGGQAGATERLLAPCFIRNPKPDPCVVPPLVGARTVFPVDPEPLSESDRLLSFRHHGASVEPLLESVDAATSISRVAAALLTMESDKDKSHKDLLRRSSDPAALIEYVSPLDHFTEFLLSGRRTVNSAAIRAAAGAVDGSPTIPRPKHEFAALLRGLDFAAEANPSLTGRDHNLVISLAPLMRFHQAPSIANYFADIGGTLNLNVSDPVTRLAALDTQRALAAVVESLEAVGEELREFQRNVFEFAEEQVKGQFRTQLRQLELAIQQAQNDALRYAADFATVLANFANLADAATRLLSAFDSFRFSEMPELLSQIALNLGEIDAVARRKANLVILRQVYTQVLTEYNEFLKQTKELKAAMYARHDKALERLIKARQSYNELAQRALSFHEDLLRLAMMNHILSRVPVNFELNLNALSTLNDPSSRGPADWSRLRQFPQICAGREVDPISVIVKKKDYVHCARSEPDPNGSIAKELRVKTGDFAGLPLYSFHPKSAPTVMELYGVFRGEELEWENAR